MPHSGDDESGEACHTDSYAFGIARNNPFVDGNKRVSLLALVTFLRLNGIAFSPAQADAAAAILALAASEVDEDGLTPLDPGQLPKDVPT